MGNLKLWSGCLMDLSQPTILILSASISVRFLGVDAEHVPKPRALLACMVPLWPGSYVRREVPLPLLSVPTAPCWCALFLQRHKEAAYRCQAPLLRNWQRLYSTASRRGLNLSVALVHPSSTGQRELEEALDYAARRGVIAVAAAGNQGAVGSSAITRHPWVIPVVAYDLQGRPIQQSNLGGSIGRRGLGAPGDDVTSLGADSRPITFGGTSIAVPFVTGAIALLWSQFPTATATEVKLALTQVSRQRRTTIVPPLLDAWAAYQLLMTMYERR